MPNYYDNQNNLGINRVRGCTAGSRKPDWSAPATRTQKQCIIYNTEKEDVNRPNSCYLHKKLETIKCPTPSSTKSINQGIPACNFKDEYKIPRMCYDTESLIDSLMSKLKIGREAAKYKIREDLMSCDYAKRFYIEKSIPPPRPAAPPPPPRITWTQIQQEFPGTSSLVCYVNNNPANNCKNIVTFCSQNPNDNNTLYIKNYCKNTGNKYTTCNQILNPTAAITTDEVNTQ